MTPNLSTVAMPYKTTQLPFRNMRDVLGLHAKVSSHKIAVISYDAAYNRREMTYLELVGKSHQVANFLYEDLGLQRGDAIAVMSFNHENTLLLYFAAWVIGATIIAIDPQADDEHLQFVLQDYPAQIVFADHRLLDKVTSFALAIGSIEGVIQIGGERHEDFLRFEDLAANRPTTFLGDESGAKGADIPLTGGNERTARLDDMALTTYTDDMAISRTQGQLLNNAAQFASATALTGNQRALATLPLHLNFAESILAPLFAGGTIILAETFSPDYFWQLLVQERANVALLDATLLETLVSTGQAHIKAGEMRFGGKIIQQDVKHVRHIASFDTSLTVEIARAFEELFGLSLITGLKHPYSDEIVTLMPITLPWQQHQAMLHGQDNLGIGVPMRSIVVSDGQGKEVAEGEIGQIMLVTENDKTLGSSIRGFYLTDNTGQIFVFLA